MNLAELAAVADQYAAVRDARLEAQRQVDAMKEDESALKAMLLQNLKESGAGGVAGKKYRVTLKSKNVPQVADWQALYEYIKANDAFELLQKRLSPPAVVERWEAAQNVDGVISVQVDELSLNKL